jgi:predicted small lipoprotein YifL
LIVLRFAALKNAIMRRIVGVLLLALLLQACGNRGPLYLPEPVKPDNKQQEKR